MARRVTVVTAGHLATCPRMLKAADALHECGYAVRVISTSQTPWAAAADRRAHARRGWRWEPIPHDRAGAPGTWFRSGLRARAAQTIARIPGLPRYRPVAFRAGARLHTELVRAILREPQDFIYGGTSGAIAAVTEASRRSGKPCAVDFEDFHCAEHGGRAHGSMLDEVAATIMADAVEHAAFVTVGSAAIGRACAERFGVAPVVINNVFVLPPRPSTGGGGGPLRLYWFSQTIGPGRGLEDAIAAIGLAGMPAELHLRGNLTAAYGESLTARCRRQAPRIRLVIHEPGDPDEMVRACEGFDIGLAIEPGCTLNNALSLPNKALTYPLAGLAIAISDTPGQRALADHLGAEAVRFEPGRVADLAAGLARWHADRGALRRAREAAWEAARERWRWDHPLERSALLSAVGSVA